MHSLRALKYLHSLWLEENACTNCKDYRIFGMPTDPPSGGHNHTHTLSHSPTLSRARAAHTHTNSRAHTHAHTHTCTHTRAHAHARTRTRTPTHPYTHTQVAHARTLAIFKRTLWSGQSSTCFRVFASWTGSKSQTMSASRLKLHLPKSQPYRWCPP